MSDHRLAHVAREIVGRPLLILPEKLAVISSVLEGRIGIDAALLDLGPRTPLSPEADAIVRNGPEASRFVGSNYAEDPVTGRSQYKPYKLTGDGVAIITITGSLVNRGAWVGASSGLTSYEGIKYQLSQAGADPKVRAIILDIESPGGQAIGAFEVADAVRALAAEKPVTAVVNGMAASAGYAIASGASKIVTTPSGMSGSIGVLFMHADLSGALQKAGITPTLIFAGARKVDGNPYQPLTDETKANLQAEVDRLYEQFVETVAAGRKDLTPKAIRDTEAETYIGSDAVKAGLADDVGTFEDVLADFTRGPSGRSTAKPRTQMNFTQQDIDAARTEGHSAGRTEGHTAGHAAGLAEGKAQGHAEGLAAGKLEGHSTGVTAERDRIKGILGSEEAKGREASALHLALATDTSVEASAGILGGLAKSGSLAERAGRTPHLPQGGADASRTDADAVAKSWEGIVASLNEKAGFKSR